MGWNPFKKTQTYQYWNVATTPLLDDALPDGFHEFAIINDVVNGIDYFKSLDYLNYSAGARTRFRQLNTKFKTKDYFGGYGDVDIGNNYVPASLVKARINPSNPTYVTITNSSVVALNYANWVSGYLVDTFNLNTVTNIFVRDGVSYTVDFNTADSVDNTVDYTNNTTLLSYTLDLPPEPVGKSYNVSYTITTPGVSGQPSTTSPVRTWTYEIGTGLYPELDVNTRLPENDPTVFQLMPPIDIRRNGGYIHSSASRHADYDDYAKNLGINPKDIADAFAGQSDMDKLDHIAVSQGVDLQAKDKHSLKYCIDFVTKLKALADTHTMGYNVNGANDNVNLGFNTQAPLGLNQDGTVFGTEHRYTPQELVDVPGVDLIVSFDSSSYGLKYSHIEIQQHTAAEVEANSVLKSLRDTAIDVGEHGRVQGTHRYKSVVNHDFSLTATMTGVTLDGGIWGYLSGIMANLNTANLGTITYYKISNIDGSMSSHMIVAPVISHYVRDAQSGQHRLVHLNLSSTDADLYFPLDWRIVNSYSNQELTSLTASSMHLSMYYAYWEQKEVWNWSLIIIVVAIVVFVYTGYDISAALAETATSLSVALGVSVSTAYLIMAVSYLASMGVFGEDYIVLGQIMTLAISMGTSTVAIGANMTTANYALQVMNMMNSYKMRHIVDEMEEIQNLGDAQLVLQDEIREEIDQAFEDMGYYYNLRKRQYIAQALINIKKVDHFEAMPSAVYFQKIKKTVSPEYTYKLQYKYI